MDFAPNFADNGDGSYTLTDADRAALRGILTTGKVIVPDFKGIVGHLVNLTFDAGVFDNGDDYNPQGELLALQTQLDDITAKMAPLQAQAATQVKLQTSLAQPEPLVP